MPWRANQIVYMQVALAVISEGIISNMKDSVTQLRDWWMETGPPCLRRRCHVAILQAPSLYNIILDTWPCPLDITFYKSRCALNIQLPLLMAPCFTIAQFLHWSHVLTFPLTPIYVSFFNVTRISTWSNALAKLRYMVSTYSPSSMSLVTRSKCAMSWLRQVRQAYSSLGRPTPSLGNRCDVGYSKLSCTSLIAFISSSVNGISTFLRVGFGELFNIYYKTF